MKHLYLAVVLISLFSCTKEKFTEPISGTWTMIESNLGNSSGYTVQTYPPSTEITIEFGANGNLLLSGANPGLALSPLWDYDKFELLPNNRIRFFQSAGRKEIEAFATVNGELYLNYPQTSYGYEEKFLKIK